MERFKASSAPGRPSEVLFLTREEIYQKAVYAIAALLIAVLGAAFFWISSLRKANASLRDSRRRAEQAMEALRRSITDRESAQDALRMSNRRFELLAGISEQLLRTDHPQTTVQTICRMLMEHIDCQFFFNYLVESPGERMHLNACAGVSEETADEIRRLDFGVAVCGCVARDSRRIIAEDIQHRVDPRTGLVKSFGVQAYCCHPLMAQGRLIGTLSFGTRTRPTFTEDEVALMKSVCDQVAVAMQRLLAQNELRELNESLEQQVAERTEQARARSKQLQILAVELIEAEERERRRIADLLHDDLQQILAAARMQLESACHSLPSEPALSNVQRLLGESIRKSRQLSHELSPPTLQHSNLISTLKWIGMHFTEQFGLEVELAAAEELPYESEPLKVFLFRAVQELLFNVVKHAGVKSARVALSRSDDCLRVTVGDRGAGFDPDALDAGTVPIGLGLLSLRERARHMGGDLKIESAPGAGSRFTVTVPLIMEAADEPTRPEVARQHGASAGSVQPADRENSRVLFVDDHEVMRHGLINLIAARPGITVAGEASNGREAIEQVRRLQPDVVVMDISMPEMDGIEATRRIKSKWPEVRVIGLSMLEDEHISRTMREAGAEALLSKTSSAAQLYQAIRGANRKIILSSE
jgi:signal transduction histidine kinase/ActR/RegA family two-component response regulator